MWIPMVFNSGFLIAVVIFLVIWNAVVTFLVVRMKRHYDRLTAGSPDGTTLTAVLDRLVVTQESHDARLDGLGEELARVETDGVSHFQKLGIVRFNPFADTGGSQSFTLAFLDAQNSGFVMTSLYARTGNRWYIKQVISGKSDGVPLSKEEQLAVANAKTIRYAARKQAGAVREEKE
jgi:hypothetical protein